jgi:hypothetical protein
MSGVFPGFLGTSDAAWMVDQWLEVPDMQKRCINVARVALGRASGREWFWAYNLIKECAASWPYLNGMLTRQGVRASDETLADWLDAAYTLLRELMDDKERKALELRLRKIPRDAVAPVRIAKSTRAELMAFGAD